ncbi:MAG: hypothetical protein V6Z89_20760 [Desulfobacter sp.]
MFRILAGFLIGSLGVVLIWWFSLNSKGEDLANGHRVDPAINIIQTIPDPKVSKKKNEDQSTPSKNVTVIRDSPPESIGIIPSSHSNEKAEVLRGENDKSKELNSIAFDEKALENGLITPETQNSVQSTSLQLSVNKKFFWKPFSLQAKAKGFAQYITSRSGVKCHTQKTGPGEYEVYFLYSDETDCLSKETLIKDTGINF